MTIGGTTKNIPTYDNRTAPSCVLFSNIVSDANGTITGIGAGNGGNARALNEANWSGFQLVQIPSSVPEPSSLILFGTGMAGLAGIVFRKVTG
jgi:hypothetical protein